MSNEQENDFKREIFFSARKVVEKRCVWCVCVGGGGGGGGGRG